MNERIIKLFMQSVDTNYIPLPIEEHIPSWTEKFAELILWECIEVCNSRVGNSDYNTGRMHCVSDLKEHFGLGMSVEDKKQLIKDLLGVQK